MSEGQCLWAIRRLLPHVPVPEIYGWSTEEGYVLLYMEMVKGVTVEKVWSIVADGQKDGFWRNLQSIVSELRTLTQEADDKFLGMWCVCSGGSQLTVTRTNQSKPVLR